MHAVKWSNMPTGLYARLLVLLNLTSDIIGMDLATGTEPTFHFTYFTYLLISEDPQSGIILARDK